MYAVEGRPWAGCGGSAVVYHPYHAVAVPASDVEHTLVVNIDKQHCY